MKVYVAARPKDSELTVVRCDFKAMGAGRFRGRDRAVLGAICLMGLITGISGCRSPRPPPPEPQQSEAGRLAQTGRRQFEAGVLDSAIRSYRLALEAARTADEGEAITRVSAHLAVALAAAGQFPEARVMARLSRAEAAPATIESWTAQVIEARIAYLQGDVDTAQALADGVWDAPGMQRHPLTRAEAGILSAQAFMENDRIEAAVARLDEAGGLIPPEAPFALRSAWQGATGQVAMCDNRPLDAASAFDRQAMLWRAAGRYADMAAALEAGGQAWLAADQPGQAADRYFRAARSLLNLRPDAARSLMQTARDLAFQLDDAIMLQRIDGLMEAE